MTGATFDFNAYDAWDEFNKRIPRLIDEAGSGTTMVHPIIILGKEHQLTLPQLRSLFVQLEDAVTRADLLEFIARESYEITKGDSGEA